LLLHRNGALIGWLRVAPASTLIQGVAVVAAGD
jgi:hypothetical protein